MEADRSPAAFEAVHRELTGKAVLETALKSLDPQASDVSLRRRATLDQNEATAGHLFDRNHRHEH